MININTRAPSFTPERSIESSVGEDGYFQTKGTISGPITDQLAGRLSAYRTSSDGDIKNEYNGHELDGGSRDGFRGQLLFKPNENFSLRWIGDYNEEDSSAGTRVLYSTGPTINGVNLYQARAAAAGATLADGRNRQVNLDGQQHVGVFQGGTSLEANWTLPNDFTLTSISAYRWWNFTPRNDDGLNVPPPPTTPGSRWRIPSGPRRYAWPRPRVGSSTMCWGRTTSVRSWITRASATTAPKADIWNGTPTGALNNVTSIGNGHIDTDSFALFAQGTWHLTERLDFTAGLRGSYEEKSAWVTRDAPVGGCRRERCRRHGPSRPRRCL